MPSLSRLSPSEERLPGPRRLPPPRSLWSESWRRLKANRPALFSLGFLAFVAALCFLGPLVYPLSPTEQALAREPAKPFRIAERVEVRYDPAQPGPDEVVSLDYFAEAYARDPEADAARLRSEGSLEIDFVAYDLVRRFHLLGSDSHGRDLLARILQGGRISLGVGVVATLISLAIGLTYGAVSGYAGGRLDAAMMRLVDILYALPFLIFVILLMVVFKDADNQILLIFLAIGAVEWLTMARIARGEVMRLKGMEFVEAARAAGARPASILRRHLLPNLLGPAIVYCTLLVPAVMLLEATLSFLGLGVQAPAASWGSLIKEGAEKMTSSPWLLVVPAAFFSATLFALNFLGDGLRDALDAKGAKD